MSTNTTSSQHDSTETSHGTTELHQPGDDAVPASSFDQSDVSDEVSDGKDGYEYHKATTRDHELHGVDLHDCVLVGAKDDDKLFGGSRNDILDGNEGNNTLDGGSGDDILLAGSQTNRGKNHLNGGSGDDIMIAGGAKTQALDNFLKNHAGLAEDIARDPKYPSLATIIHGSTDDTGGGAVNTFELQSGNGHDSIFNFHASSDKLQIHRGLNDSDIQDTASLLKHIHVSGDEVTIDLGKGNSITLVGVDTSHLSAANLDWV